MMTSKEFRDAMTAKGYLKQIDMADALGVDQATVSRWLNGSRPIPDIAIRAIAGLPLNAGTVRGKVGRPRKNKVA